MGRNVDIIYIIKQVIPIKNTNKNIAGYTLFLCVPALYNESIGETIPLDLFCKDKKKKRMMLFYM